MSKTEEYSLTLSDYVNPQHLIGKFVIYEWGSLGTTYRQVSHIVSANQRSFKIEATGAIEFSLIDGKDTRLRAKANRKMNMGTTRQCILIHKSDADQMIERARVKKAMLEDIQFISSQLQGLSMEKLSIIRKIIQLK